LCKTPFGLMRLQRRYPSSYDTAGASSLLELHGDMAVCFEFHSLPCSKYTPYPVDPLFRLQGKEWNSLFWMRLKLAVADMIPSSRTPPRTAFIAATAAKMSSLAKETWKSKRN